MSTQFDDIAYVYNEIRDVPGDLLEIANVREAVKPFIQNATVLDLACGTGFYSRLLLDWGARKVVGIDISKEMLALADSSILNTPGHDYTGRLSFRVGDCTKPTKINDGPFDFVFAAWLLNFAPAAKELVQMVQFISLNLRDGGSFIGVARSPTNDPKDMQSRGNQLLLKYGFTNDCIGDIEDGISIRAHVTGHTSRETVEFNDYHLRQEVYERSIREGGMRGNLEWRKLSVPVDAEDIVGKKPYGYWDDYVEEPIFGLLIVQK